jgi:glycosyltransferase involved in cell wall biosynthesis
VEGQLREVIFIVTNTSWNAWNFRLGLINFIKNRGYRVIVLAPYDPFSDKLSQHGIEFIHVDLASDFFAPLRILKANLKLMYLFFKVKPKYCFSFTILPNFSSLIAGLFSRKTIIVPNISGLGRAFDRENLLSKIALLIYRVLLVRAKHVFFQNSQDAEFLVKKRCVNEDKINLLPGSGVNLLNFKPAVEKKSLSTKARFSFLLFARLLASKGIREYVHSARCIKKLKNDVEFFIAGSFASSSADSISFEEMATWCDEGTVNYLGDVDDISATVANADCIVLPTYYNEGVPKSLIEAAACGVPIIATNIKGCTRIALDNYNALLCEPKDVNSLTNAMQKMIETPWSERQKLGSNGRILVEEQFDERIVFLEYQKVVNF